MNSRERSRFYVGTALGVFVLFAGIAHLTFAREEFNAQVPAWMPIDDAFVVVASGVVEILLGAAMLLFPRHRKWSSIALALFFIAIFPGNIAQYVDGVDAFGLDTDTKRFVRLFFQPVLVAGALWSAGFPQTRGDDAASDTPDR